MTGSDRQQLSTMAGKTKDALGVETLDVLADRGYFSGEEILACEAQGVTPYVPRPLTSTAKAQRRLGRRWLRLHRLVYAVAFLGVWHFWWQVKKDVSQPILYAVGLGLLLAYRLWKHRRTLGARFSAARFATPGAP